MSDSGAVSGVLAALAGHPFVDGLATEDVEALASCGALREHPAGGRVAVEGDPAEGFHLVVAGRVGIEAHLPRRGAVVVATVDAGEVLGWSWLFPPHLWSFDAVAMTGVTEVVLGATPLHAVLADRPLLAAEVTRRLGTVVAERLRSARTQLLDLYGAGT